MGHVTDIAANLAAARARIDAACARAGRDPSAVELLPVSKTHPPDAVRAARAAGYVRFGENKPQELRDKAAALAGLGLQWVAIGHLQTNKARLVAEDAAEFQALDSLRLAEALDRRLQAAGRRLRVLLEVNTSGEGSKGGFAPAEVPDAVRALRAYDALDVAGLMTIAANTPDEAVQRACFTSLAGLAARLRGEWGGFEALSMGMSADFETAVECGATCVRLGTMIFGPRSAPVRTP